MAALSLSWDRKSSNFLTGRVASQEEAAPSNPWTWQRHTTKAAAPPNAMQIASYMPVHSSSNERSISLSRWLAIWPSIRTCTFACPSACTHTYVLCSGDLGTRNCPLHYVSKLMCRYIHVVYAKYIYSTYTQYLEVYLYLYIHSYMFMLTYPRTIW